MYIDSTRTSIKVKLLKTRKKPIVKKAEVVAEIGRQKKGTDEEDHAFSC